MKYFKGQGSGSSLENLLNLGPGFGFAADNCSHG